MMQVDFGRLGESHENETPLKKPYEANSARPTTLMNVNTLSNTGTERTLMSPAKPPEQQAKKQLSLFNTRPHTQ